MRTIAWPDDIQSLLGQLDGLLAHASQGTLNLAQSLNYRCRSGCGKCCTSPHVEAMPVEMLRMAAHILECGEEESWWRIIEADGLPCPVYVPVSKDQPEKGSCSLYDYRPSVCRLFGFAFSSTKSAARLALCAILKNDYPHLVATGPESVPVPVFMTDYHSQLSSLSGGALAKEVPIREALSVALRYLMSRIVYQMEPCAFSFTTTPPLKPHS